MVKPISLKCPYCGQQSEIMLSTGASMILLNCPGCLKPLIYHKHRCFMLNRRQVKQLESAPGEFALHRMLEKIVRSRMRSVPAASSAKKQARWGTPPKWARDIARTEISRDDITNLRIDLETCPDSSLFIEKM